MTTINKKEKKILRKVLKVNNLGPAQTKKKNRRRRSNKNRQWSSSAYNGAAPLSTNKPFVYSHPKIVSGAEITRVSHKEYLGDLRFPVDGATFEDEAIISYLGNPADPNSFPWLSQIAKMYEKYRFISVIYHFRPYKSADKSGQIILVPFYDVLDEDPESKEQFMQSPHAVMSKLWAESDCWVVSNKTVMKDEKFTRYHPITTGQDAKTYDEYKFFVYMQQSTEEIEPVGGTLEVEYIVELYKPRPNPGEIITYAWTPSGITTADFFDPTELDSQYGQQAVRAVKPGTLWNTLEFLKDFTGHFLMSFNADDSGTPGVVLNGPGEFHAVRVNNATGTQDVSYLMGSVHARTGTEMVFSKSGVEPTNAVKFVLGTMLKDFFAYWLPGVALPEAYIQKSDRKIVGLWPTVIKNGVFKIEADSDFIKVVKDLKRVSPESLEKYGTGFSKTSDGFVKLTKR